MEPSNKKNKKSDVDGGDKGGSEKPSLTREITQFEMQRLLKSMNIQTKRTFLFLSEVESGNPVERYYPQDFPKKWDYPCIKCGEKFDEEPVPRIPKWNNVKGVPVIDKMVFFCSDLCAKSWIIESSFTEKGVECENIARWFMEYKNQKIEKISYLPLSFKKSRSPAGFMTDEEWKEKSQNSYGFYVNPPFQLVETTSVISEKPLLQKTAKELGYKHNNVVTDEQQENFTKSLEAVRKQYKQKSTSSNLGKKGNEGIRNFFS